jgi:hypothetical protein
VSRKLLKTVISTAAPRMRVLSAVVAAMALGVGGAAAATGSLGSLNVSDETTVTTTATSSVQSGDDQGDHQGDDQGEDADEQGQTPQPEKTTEATDAPDAADTQASDATSTDATDPATQGTARDLSACPTVPGVIFRNHGDYVSWVAQGNDPTTSVSDAAHSTCGMPLVATGGDATQTPDATATTEAAPQDSTDGGDASTSTTQSHGKSGSHANGHAKTKTHSSHGRGHGRS